MSLFNIDPRLKFEQLSYSEQKLATICTYLFLFKRKIDFDLDLSIFDKETAEKVLSLLESFS